MTQTTAQDQVQDQNERPRRLPLRAALLLSIASISALAFVRITERVLAGDADAFDREWMMRVRQADSDVLDVVMIVFTTLGANAVLWAAIALVGFLAIQRGLWRLAVTLVAIAAIAQITNRLMKLEFERLRPTLFEEITRPETFSFPSGHAMQAMAIYGSIAAVAIALRPHWRFAVIAIAVVLIASIGLSRVYLGVHWPTDVVGGFAAGAPLVVVSVHLVHRITRLERRSRRPLRLDEAIERRHE